MNKTLVASREHAMRHQLKQAIQKALSDTGLNQTQLAKRSGIHPSHLSEIMNERVNPKFKTIAKLETGLGRNLLRCYGDPPRFELEN